MRKMFKSAQYGTVYLNKEHERFIFIKQFSESDIVLCKESGSLNGYYEIHVDEFGRDKEGRTIVIQRDRIKKPHHPISDIIKKLNKYIDESDICGYVDKAILEYIKQYYSTRAQYSEINANDIVSYRTVFRYMQNNIPQYDLFVVLNDGREKKMNISKFKRSVREMSRLSRKYFSEFGHKATI